MDIDRRFDIVAVDGTTSILSSIFSRLPTDNDGLSMSATLSGDFPVIARSLMAMGVVVGIAVDERKDDGILSPRHQFLDGMRNVRLGKFPGSPRVIVGFAEQGSFFYCVR